VSTENLQDHVKKEIEIFAERLQSLMQATGMKPVELARKAAIPNSTLAEYVHARRNPSLENIVRIIRNVGVSAEWLLLGEGKMMREEVSRVDIGILTEVIAMVEGDLNALGLAFSAENKARVVAMLYEEELRGATMDTKRALRYLSLIK
jgi:predicted transcriptional regulator